MWQYNKRSLLNVLFIISLSLSFGIPRALAQTTSVEEYDIVLLGGRVIDPETGLDDIRNIGINDSKIAIVTAESITGEQKVNAKGLVISPGFIDMHAHGQTILSGRVQAFDGVTTALELESGTFPVDEFYQIRAKEGRPINYGASVNWLSTRIATLLNVEPSSEASWFSEMMNRKGWQNSIATREQLSEIERQVSEGLDAGGLGVGFLTGYAPGSGHKEYYRVSKLAAERGAPTFTHARYLSMAEPESSFEAIQEIISVAASTGVHAHIVHLNSISLKDIQLIADMISTAQEAGVQLSTEAYPYGAGATSIGAEMFRGEGWRERIGNISAENFAVDGKRLSEAEFAQLQEEAPGTDIIIHFLETENPAERAFIDHALLMPGGVIASDGGDWLNDGEPVDELTWPLPNSAWSHPRSAGTFTRFISQYAVQREQLPLSDAIAKVSLLPAQLLEDYVPSMKHKGRIQVGSDADLAVFSLTELADAATYAKPAQLSRGMKYLLVNGQFLIHDGVLNTNVLPGKAVRNN
ncbi:amidohydrolase family protein [Idiomarina sp.]|uniref:amidohydrolase family protein n=1 Tax=Idiomarina sp. TaxID=1874361 RepID=UPI003A92556F